MSENLLQQLSALLTPELVGKIAQALGVGRDNVQTALSGALPGVLASIIGVAERPGGPERIMAAVEAQERQAPDLLSRLGPVLSGANASSLAEGGSGMLSTLLGGAATGGIAKAVARFAGIGESSASSLVGLAGPVIMSLLGKQASASGYDAAGLATMLRSQKSAVRAAIPTEFADLMATSTESLRGQPLQPVRSASAAPAAVTATSRGAPASRRWWPWTAVAAAVVLAALLWQFFGRPEPRQIAIEPPAAPAPAADQSLVVNGVDLGEQLQGIVSGVRDQLGAVKDQNTAQAVGPKLDDLARRLDELVGSAGTLPSGAATVLAGIAGSALPAIKDAVASAKTFPGVGEQLGPVLDRIVAKLESLATA